MSYRPDKQSVTDGRTDGQTDGQTDRRTDGRTEPTTVPLGQIGRGVIHTAAMVIARDNKHPFPAVNTSYIHNIYIRPRRYTQGGHRRLRKYDLGAQMLSNHKTPWTIVSE